MSDHQDPRLALADAARAAGASRETRVFLRTEDPDGFLNSRLRRHYDHDRERLDPGVVSEIPNGRHGDFVRHLWDGRLGEAWAHADYTNRETLLESFTDATLSEAIREELGWPEDSVTEELRDAYMKLAAAECE